MTHSRYHLQSARGQGPHLERLTEHLKQLQNELSSEKATRQSTHKVLSQG
jgi:hypothetical protein